LLIAAVRLNPIRCFEGSSPAASPWVKQLEQQLKQGKNERQAIHASIMSDLSTASTTLKTKEANQTRSTPQQRSPPLSPAW